MNPKQFLKMKSKSKQKLKVKREDDMTKNDTLLQCFEWYLPEDGKFLEER
jgi:hypothetical protein